MANVAQVMNFVADGDRMPERQNKHGFRDCAHFRIVLLRWVGAAMVSRKDVHTGSSGGIDTRRSTKTKQEWFSANEGTRTLGEVQQYRRGRSEAD